MLHLQVQTFCMHCLPILLAKRLGIQNLLAKKVVVEVKKTNTEREMFRN